MAAVPGTPTFSNVFYTSFKVKLPPHGNPVGTTYEISESTDNFVTSFSTPVAFTDGFTLASTTFMNLIPATTYYLRLRAINGDGLFITAFSAIGSTVTLGVPVPTNLHGMGIGVSSITWVWDPVDDAATYTLYEATSPATVIASGIPGPLYTEVGLSTNTAYDRVVISVDDDNNVSGLSAAATAYTLALVPGAATFSNVSYDSFTLTWTDGGNPAGTVYQVSESTDATFATAISTPIVLGSSFTALTTTFMNLIPATTYYVRIQAENGDSIATTFSVVSDTETLNAPAPIILSGTAVGVSSISWTWSSVIDATSYKVYQATSTGTLLISTTTPAWIDTGLSTNTDYGIVVTAVVGGAQSDFSASRTTSTLASVPGIPTFLMVGLSSFTVSWNVNGNPSGTNFEVSESTDPTFGLAVSTPITFADNFTTNTTNIVGLSGGTTYYVRVRAENNDAIATAFSLIGSTETLTIGIPANLTGTAIGVSSITWTMESGAGAPALIRCMRLRPPRRSSHRASAGHCMWKSDSPPIRRMAGL